MAEFSMTYDTRLSWEENALRGPCFSEPVPTIPATPMKSFLGLPVRSCIGIAAGLLPNSRWVLPYAGRGWDLLTYKTVRGKERPSYPPPNWVFVDEDPAHSEGPVWVREHFPSNAVEASASVCFGMPSASPAEWRPDVAVARRGLLPGQVLIVSVVASPVEGDSVEAVAEDFSRCASWAKEAGAQVVEANLSCPNVCSAEGSLYQDSAASRLVSKRIRSVIGDTPLLLKIGAFASEERMAEFVRAVGGLASGITLVNCLSRPVLHRDGNPVFGERFRVAGVLGRAIHRPSLELVRSAVDRVEREKLGLAIVAVGGASCSTDFEDFFNAGAAAVLCGSSPAYLPHLAAELKHRHPEW